MRLLAQKSFLLFCFLVFVENIYAQTKAIDSLENVLSRHIQKDTTKVNLLNELANSYLEKDSVKTMAYLEESQTIAEAIGFEKGLAKVLFMKGSIQFSKSNYPQAIKLFDKARLLYVKIDSKEALAECFVKMGLTAYNQFNFNRSIEYFKKSIAIYNNISQTRKTITSLKFIGYCFTDMGNYEKAEEYLEDALSLSKKFSDSVEMANSTNVIGTISLHKGNYPLALENYNKALAIYEKINDQEGVAIVLNNKGIIHKNHKNYDRALYNYQQALKIEKKFENKKNYALGLNNIGVVYKQKKDYKNSLLYLKDALKISESINDKDNIARCLINLGDVYLGLKNNELALKAFLEAKDINNEIGAQLGLCYSFLGVARVYEKEKKYGLALVNALESRKISKEIGLLDYHRDVYKVLSNIYEKTKNYKKAFESHQQFKILNDSLFNKKNVEKIAQLESEYKYKQALDSANIRELKLTKTVLTTSQDLATSKQKYLLAVIGILIVSIVLGGAFFFQKYQNMKAKNQTILTEQKLLRSQMTPHFMFNSLSVLQGMILNQEESKSLKYLSKFSKLLRSTLENSRYKMVPLTEELSVIDNYMELQNIDTDPPFNYKLSIDLALKDTNVKIPPMLIQPFVENSVEHAFDAKNGDKQIEVSLCFKNEILTCTIIDNGRGVRDGETEIRKDKKSLATTITSERVHMLGKEFGIPGSVTIQNRKSFGEEGTSVTLIIPYKIEAYI